MKVKEVEIKGSHLVTYSSDAFNSDTFKTSLTSIFIDNEKNNADDLELYVESLKGLRVLENLDIRNYPKLKIENTKALDSLKSTLLSLKMTRTASEWPAPLLLATVNLTKLTELDLQQNIFKSINGSFFKSTVATVKILKMTHCQIETIQTGAFDTFISLEMLILGNNFLTKLPLSMFNNVFEKNQSVLIFLTGNRWHCDCDLYDFQSVYIKRPANFAPQDSSLQCFTPPDKLFYEIASIDLCADPLPTIIIPSTLQLTSTENICDNVDNPLCTSTVTQGIRNTY